MNTMNGYPYFYDSKHPLSLGCGYVYVHRVVASEMLGRNLTSEENVHHIDGNRSNNCPDNLMVFDSTASHRLFHSGEPAEKRPDGVFTVKKTFYLCKCGQKMWGKKALNCGECEKNRRNKINISDDDLATLVSKSSLEEISKKLGVRGQSLGRYLRKRKIPYKSQKLVKNSV